MAAVHIFKSYLKTQFLLLLGVETAVVFGMVYSGSLIRFYASGLPRETIFDGLWPSAIVIAVVTALTMLSTGLYIGHLREGMSGVLIRVVIAMAMSALVVSVIFYLFPDISLWRGVVAIIYLQAFFVIGTIRTVFFELVDTQAFKSRVLVYGAGSDASYINRKLRRKSDRRGFEIVGYVLLENQERKVSEDLLLHIGSSLLEYVERNNINEIVVASNDVKEGVHVGELVDCKLNGVGILDLLSFFEREAGQIRIDIIDPAWLVTTEGFGQSTLQGLVKRLFDILVSSVFLVGSLPVQALIVLAIWIEDGFGKPVFYHQERTGENGKSFNVYKFRSMVSDAEKQGQAQWATQGDSRVTRTGAFLRKYRLDEIPQVINIIVGDMSFVGPRPERPEFVEELAQKIPYYKERHVLKPGLTGWAQLNYPYGSSIEDAYQKQLYDMYYVKNHSIFLDSLILLQTVEVVLFGKGGR